MSRTRSLFEKCNRCRDKPATVMCSACGIAEDAKYCYDCDNLVHKISFKKSHNRTIITFDQSNINTSVE